MEHDNHQANPGQVLHQMLDLGLAMMAQGRDRDQAAAATNMERQFSGLRQEFAGLSGQLDECQESLQNSVALKDEQIQRLSDALLHERNLNSLDSLKPLLLSFIGFSDALARYEQGFLNPPKTKMRFWKRSKPNTLDPVAVLQALQTDLQNTFGQFGIEPITGGIGEKFDPSRQVAVSTSPVRKAVADNTVLSEIRPGWIANMKRPILLRAQGVVVGVLQQGGVRWGRAVQQSA